MDFIDLRSDTVTIPTEEMRNSLLDCICGDDVYDDDFTVNKLNGIAEQLLQKEKCLFFPSGTMANQVAIMSNAILKGDEILVSQKSHIYNTESGAIATLSGAMVRFYKVDTTTGEIDVNDLETLIRKKAYDFYPKTALIIIESPSSQGKVLTLNNMKEIYNLAQKWSIPVHLDSSRLFNACAKLNIEPNEISRYCDSIMLCLSKGLCAPAGSLLLGSNEFMMKVKRYRKMIGGTMRQVGVLAAPGIIALTKMRYEIGIDNEIMKNLASQLEKIQQIRVLKTDINMAYIFLEDKSQMNSLKEFLFQRKIKIQVPIDSDLPIRILCHYYIRCQQVEIIVKGFNDYFEQKQ